MCGITGFTHHDRELSSVLQKATRTLRHRGPDEINVFESTRVSIGAVRLKIVDLNGGQQPMTADSHDCVLAFNGEIYNHAELRAELEELGHKFRSDCDTEVALRAFVEWDIRSFERLRGMFAAAFWQEGSRRLILVRDRLGIKPLYYALPNRQIFFGSELKALFEHNQIPRQISKRALAYYLSLNYIPGPLTLVESIKKIQPGTWLEWIDGNVTRGTYWQNELHPEEISAENASRELDRLLEESIREHMIADVPVGLWLSGGLDSSTLLHYAARDSRRQIKTFSISFEGRRCDESRYQRALAAHYGTEHHELDLNSDLDLVGAIHDLSYYSDEPSADAGALPAWFLSKMTARQVRVTLSGEGADEIFGGYETYLADDYARIARRFPKFLLHAASRTAGLLPTSDRKISFEYKLKRFLKGSLLPNDEAHFFWNGTFSEGELRELGFDSQGDSLGRLVRDLPNLPSAHNCNRYLFIDQHFYLPDDILYKCDRVSMAHSLEVRPPFLDHRVVEFACRLPPNLKIRGSETKVLLRRLMRDKLPRCGVNPRKEGLDIPTHEWLRGPLRPLLLETLSVERVKRAGLFSHSTVQRLIDAHLSRRANLGYHLWGLITLHLWIHRWNIQTEDERTHSLSGSLVDAAAG